MDPAAFTASLAAPAPPPGLPGPLRALWHAARGEWDAAHGIVQQHGGSIEVECEEGEGTKFIIALPGTDLEGGLQVARRIKERPAAGFAVDGSTLLHVAVTIGVSDLDETSFSLEMLITRADKALYTAKAAGKNCIGAWSAGEFKVYE